MNDGSEYLTVETARSGRALVWVVVRFNNEDVEELEEPGFVLHSSLKFSQ